jgi:site-specific DNA-adenine methylase
MFSYYGSKSKIVNCYPKPKYGKIIEPFAGSARYSLKWWENDILLVDKFDVIVKTWKWLQQCSYNDIVKLPRLTNGMDIRTLGLTEDELRFVGFMAGIAQGKPRMKVSPFAAIHFEEARKSKYETIAEQLHKIKHWQIRCASYEEIENEEATWFIDPPYQFGGQHQYQFGNKHLDYMKLSEWCKNREGQVIACENTKADWLNFKPMKTIQGAANSFTTEAIWSNERTNYDEEQCNLFATVALQNVK